MFISINVFVHLDWQYSISRVYLLGTKTIDW